MGLGDFQRGCATWSLCCAHYLVVLLCCVSACVWASAADVASLTVRTTSPNISLQMGGYFSSNNRIHDLSLAFEYQYYPTWTRYQLQPIAGFLWTTCHDMFIFSGMMKTWHVGESWRTSLSFSPMLYSHNGAARDLGLPLEFRTKIEWRLRLPNQAWVGLGLSHISNGNLSHIFGGGKNPGVEILSLSYTLPV